MLRGQGRREQPWRSDRHIPFDRRVRLVRPGATVVMPAEARTPTRCAWPRPATPRRCSAAGIQFYWGGRLPGAETSTYGVNQADGWYHAPDVEPCPVGQTSSGGNLNAVMPGGKLVVDKLRSAGLHEADYDT